MKLLELLMPPLVTTFLAIAMVLMLRSDHDLHRHVGLSPRYPRLATFMLGTALACVLMRWGFFWTGL